MPRLTAPKIMSMKNKQKIVMLTAYDYPTAKILDVSGVDILLVGDSVGNVILGYDSTIPVSIEDMVHHCRAVSKAVQNSLVVGDMPFMTYQQSNVAAVKNAGMLVKAGCQAVKLEGGKEMSSRVKAIVNSGIPVMAHIGLTPQSVNKFGGYKVQGKTGKEEEKLLSDAKSLEKAGAFSLVLECVPAKLAKKITESISIPTIGIGAGKNCDGQVLVINDLVGLKSNYTNLKFVKEYAQIGKEISKAVKAFSKDVRKGKFPEEKHSF